MATTERMKVSFGVKEHGAEPPMPHIIEVEPFGKRLPFLVGDSDTLYLELKNKNSREEAYEVAEYLRQHVEGITLLTFP